MRHSSPACPTLTPGCKRPPAVTTGFSHDLLLLCAAGDREGVERLASRLRNAGQRVAVEVMVEDLAPAVALADGLAQAAVVLLTLSERFQQEWSSEDIAALHQAEKTRRWLVLQLDGQEIPESWTAGVEVIVWSPDDHGNSKRSRQALARIQALLDPSIAQPATEDTPADRRRKARDDFSSDVKRALYSRVGGYCSCPSCPNTTSGPHSDAAKATNTGVAAHISAAAPGGPRYNPSLTSAQRASAENGIWLCQICAKLIDNDPAAFPEALLLQWKKDAEQAALARQKGIAKSPHSGPRLPKHTPHNLPERTTTPEHFVGRDAQLEKLGELLAAPGSRVLLTGMGGVGKSELALQHAYGQLVHYRGGIVRVDARQGFDGMAAQVIAFVRGTFPELLPEKGPPDELLPLCWSQWPAAAAEPEPVLLLLDDLASDADGAKSEERLCQGLPPRFRRLITRREKAPRNARSLDLERLQRPDALRLLSFHADGDEPNPRVQREPEAADGLCEAVGDLPLALVLLGARLADRPDLPLKALLQELEANGAEARALLEAHPELGARLGVVESLLISWAPLSGPAQELAVLLSLMAPAVIPWDLVESCRRDDQELVEGQAFGDAQAALLRSRLLDRVSPGLYQLHPLVYSFFSTNRSRASSENSQAIDSRQFAKWMAKLCQNNCPAQLKLHPACATHLRFSVLSYWAWLTPLELLRVAIFELNLELMSLNRELALEISSKLALQSLSSHKGGPIPSISHNASSSRRVEVRISDSLENELKSLEEQMCKGVKRERHLALVESAKARYGLNHPIPSYIESCHARLINCELYGSLLASLKILAGFPVKPCDGEYDLLLINCFNWLIRNRDRLKERLQDVRAALSCLENQDCLGGIGQ